MRRKSAPERADSDISTLAARQFGVVAVRQLYALGLSERQVGIRVEARWLHNVHRGVYAVGYRPLTRRGEWMAAVLAIGDGAVLSHRSAAALWRIWGEGGRAVVEVIVPRRDGRQRRPGIEVHRPAVLPPDELSVHVGIPVTTPSRTLMDLAASLPGRSLERAIDEAERRKLCTFDELATVIRVAKRPGSRRLRATLARHAPGSTFTRSELEERFLSLCRKHSLPSPLRNSPVLDYEADCLWPDEKLIVELDGRASHGTRAAFQRDRDRDTRLQAHGYRTMRFTWFDVTRRPTVVVDRVRRALG